MQTTRTLRLEPGEVLLREGEQSARVYWLKSGQLEISARDEDGREQLFGHIEAGNTVGEMSLLSGKPHSATVRATRACELTWMSHAELSELPDDPDTEREALLFGIANSLVRHLDRTTNVAVGALSREMDQLRMRTAISHFLLFLLLGFSGYALVMKALSSWDVSSAHTTAVTGPMLVVMLVMTLGFMHKSELAWSDFGIKRGPWLRWMGEGLVWTLPVLAVLTLLKAAVVAFLPEYGATTVFTAFSTPFHAPTAMAYGVYVLLVPIQEVMSRGALQGPLYQFLTGSQRSRAFWSILVSNALFGITHLHLTITYAVVAFLSGCFWGVIYARQKSVVGPSVSHALIGVWGLYVLGFGRLLQGG